MKFLTFLHNGMEKIGVLLPEGILDLSAAGAGGSDAGGMPGTMLELIDGGEAALALIKRLAEKKNPAHILPLSAVAILAPIPRPRKNIFCVGKNYVDHVAEMSGKLPEHPVIFSKPPTSVIGPEMEIDSHPAVTSELDYEGELAVVIGRRAKSVSKQNALDFVFGYTILNDVTARDKQSLHGQWLLGKAFDTFCPMGPVLVHKDDMPNPHNLELSTRVNGEVRQATNTSLMIFDIATVIATITQGTTLEPGDIIATGTPSGVGKGMKPPGYMKAGDVVEVEIKGIGTLRNPVA
ncbi:FAA hydrolase family protein [Oxalobacteraceae bacterium CAVE-383]|nr:FAA hydrolase family protein [Oxalobacteraceae bacterium CAVE-383]